MDVISFLYEDTMHTERTIITEGGRIVIPSSMRKELGLEIGQEILLKIEDGEIHVSSYKNIIKAAQNKIKKYNKKNISLTDILFKTRKEESDNEK